MFPLQSAKFVVIKSIDAPDSPGFIVRNIKASPTHNSSGEEVYQVLGYANNVNEAAAIIFPESK